MWPVRWPPPRTFSPCPLDINNIGELFAAGSDFSSEMTAVGRCMLLIKPGQFFSYSSSRDKLVKSGRFDTIGGESHKVGWWGLSEGKGVGKEYVVFMVLSFEDPFLMALG